MSEILPSQDHPISMDDHDEDSERDDRAEMALTADHEADSDQ